MGARYVAFCLFLSFLQGITAQNQDASKVLVTVYYEALCPDSIKFFTSQLYPTLQTPLSKHIDLTLIPYGKASQKYTNAWEFECHHGPNECYGNKVQACAIKEIGAKSDGLGFHKVTSAFINCLMAKVTRTPFDLPIDNCATVNSVQDIKKIVTCANTTEGSTLLSHLGDLTNKFQQPLKSVPTIVFNQNYKKEDNDLSQVNFPKALCGYITTNKPAECQKSGSATISSLIQLIALPILTIIYMY